jgi:hypothetical protein
MGGKSKKGGKKDGASPALDEDALLDAAIAENLALKAKAESEAKLMEVVKKEVKEAKKKKSLRVLQMSETMAKLDRVMVFHITRTLPDGNKDVVVVENTLIFYVDAADVQTDLEELKAADPSLPLSIEHVPLGKAFALVQGLQGLTGPPGVKRHLQFSRAVVKAEGERGIPAELREQMRSGGPMPMFYSEKIELPGVTPIFFTRDDLLKFWEGSLLAGAPHAAKAPPVTVTDLRYVVARTLQEAGDWEALFFVPPSRSAELSTAVRDAALREAEMARGFESGAQRLQAVMHAERVASGEEPPPLTAAAS